MTDIFRVIDHDIIYLSYDEPNAEQNYSDLCSKVPWAKRVHGVEGSDSAHKACAELSETDRFITIDGDNRIREDFLMQEANLSEFDLTDKVISWTALNQINGLSYGNGGIKCWPKKHVLSMKTHENADPDNPHAQVDFCWDLDYIQMNGIFSDVYNNATPQQAWRAGFREGVKMALDQGVKPEIEDFKNNHWKNMHRLYIWLMIGADVENGKWAIFGAREGLVKTMLSNWDYVNVRDFEYLNNYWKEIKNKIDENNIDTHIENLGDELINNLEIPIGVRPLDAGGSRFFKTVYKNPVRNPKFIDKEIG
tara:strand:+ start:3169 stop:4092 length:924 start_codon:yes stop_codon:yes gene_type:complete